MPQNKDRGYKHSAGRSYKTYSQQRVDVLSFQKCHLGGLNYVGIEKGKKTKNVKKKKNSHVDTCIHVYHTHTHAAR